ncbi:hypothetical protein [Vibrio quintilis]|uniref:Uncharacterized protein n=1 Tax=Vibrio quintilis TaxID=1117707 RepID=A0A1M7YXZ2_9VIBR|nr:hypothetical protein [Vibrio quintilis]SHO57464.1 hypothetical protein VQ7734_03234 [Vibrio quintilis]
MKLTKFVAPLLLLPSLAFAHSTEMIFNAPILSCGTNYMNLTLSNLSDHNTNVKVELYNKSGQPVTPTASTGMDDFLPNENFTIPANSSVVYYADFRKVNGNNDCSTSPVIIKIIKDKNSEILATGYKSATNTLVQFNINQGKAF